MEPDDIKDRESLRAWLEEQPVQVSRAIATRCALRVLPLVFEIWGVEEIRGALKRDLTLAVWRADVISLFASTYPNSDMSSAASAASAAM